jgi:hypothetical protein
LTCQPAAGTRWGAAAASSSPTCNHGTWARAGVRPGPSGPRPRASRSARRAMWVRRASDLPEGLEPADRDRRGAVPGTRDRAGHPAIEPAQPEQLSASSKRASLTPGPRLERVGPQLSDERDQAQAKPPSPAGVRGSLKRTLESTNPCESMIERVRRASRNVKYWQSGDLALRWPAAGDARGRASVPLHLRLGRYARHRLTSRRGRRRELSPRAGQLFESSRRATL